ncbi:MAG: hypothetical protein AAGJ35_09485, partial [Myxococcota bacterium]
MTRHISLFVFIDAMGWDIVEQHNAFSWIRKYRKPARTILGYSSTCIPSILSGKLPQEHLHWTLFQRRQASRMSTLSPLQALRFLPSRVARHHRFRHLLSKTFAKVTGIDGYFDLYALD